MMTNADSGTLTAETIGDGWLVDGSAYRTWANRTSEMANDRICGVCKEETTEWTCQCGDPDEAVVLRGARSKIKEGVTRFNMQESSLVMELAKLGDMLTTQAWEAIILRLSSSAGKEEV